MAQGKVMDLKSEKDVWDLQNIKRAQLVDVKEVPLLDTTAEKWEEVWRFKARPDDLLICTYPKAGTTWVQEIVSMIQHGGDTEKCDQLPITERIPFLELFINDGCPTSLEVADAMPSPRTLKSHLPVQLLPPSFWEQKSKIIYVARNAKDNATSYFHFHRMNKGMPEPGTWDQFLENFIEGKVAWGSWFDHVIGWWKAKNHYPILYLFYEDIKEDPAKEIQKIAQFLNLDLPEVLLNQVMQHTAFENMKQNPKTNFTNVPSFIMDQSVSAFMRKGTVGDWKNQFTVAQSEWLDDACAQLLKGINLTFRTQL
uniref:Sulfotransferase n=2 Tax=Salvator merianae TaxID=96440 RepID=A0A8D0DHX8_SALMN